MALEPKILDEVLAGCYVSGICNYGISERWLPNRFVRCASCKSAFKAKQAGVPG